MSWLEKLVAGAEKLAGAQSTTPRVTSSITWPRNEALGTYDPPRIRLLGEENPNAEFAEYDVVGESHYQQALWEIAGGVPGHTGPVDVDRKLKAILVPEPWNSRDSNAVRVVIDGKLVGYLARDEVQGITGKIIAAANNGKVIQAHAYLKGGGIPRGATDRLKIGVDLLIDES